MLSNNFYSIIIHFSIVIYGHISYGCRQISSSQVSCICISHLFLLLCPKEVTPGHVEGPERSWKNSRQRRVLVVVAWHVRSIFRYIYSSKFICLSFEFGQNVLWPIHWQRLRWGQWLPKCQNASRSFRAGAMEIVAQRWQTQRRATKCIWRIRVDHTAHVCFMKIAFQLTKKRDGNETNRNDAEMATATEA